MASACYMIGMLALPGPTTYTTGWRYWDSNGDMRHWYFGSGVIPRQNGILLFTSIA